MKILLPDLGYEEEDIIFRGPRCGPAPGITYRPTHVRYAVLSLIKKYAFWLSPTPGSYTERSGRAV